MGTRKAMGHLRLGQEAARRARASSRMQEEKVGREKCIVSELYSYWDEDGAAEVLDEGYRVLSKLMSKE